MYIDFHKVDRFGRRLGIVIVIVMICVVAAACIWSRYAPRRYLYETGAFDSLPDERVITTLEQWLRVQGGVSSASVTCNDNRIIVTCEMAHGSQTHPDVRGKFQQLGFQVGNSIESW